jgi:signal transduction histidine kinase
MAENKTENKVLGYSTDLLKKFMAFVRKGHLDALARKNISLVKTLDIPLLRLFSHLTDEDMFPMTRTNLDQFLKDFEDGRAYEVAAENLIKWENDELPGISKNDIEPSDLVFISVAQKQSLISFIPEFTKDISTAIKIVEELEEFYMITTDKAFNLYSKLKALAIQETASLKKANEAILQEHVFKLELSNNELEAFSYSVSHDLRAPLRHINGYIDMLRENIQNLLDEKNLRYMNVISDAAKRMGNLIDELLAFSRLGSTELIKTKVNLNDLLKEVINNLESDITGRNIVWKISPLPNISADKNLLRMVFENLISNAVKYTKKCETAIVEISSIENDSEITILIRDNGAGFNMKYTHKLFGLFQRLHGSDEFEGIGIGLANVKRIINKHKGRVWAEGNLNEGATFYLTLPV